MGVVRPSPDDWHDVQSQLPVELLRHVVAAQRVLEGQVELVLLLQEPVAVLGVPPAAGPVAALAEDVNSDVLLQLPDVVLPPGWSLAAADHPGGQAGLGQPGHSLPRTRARRTLRDPPGTSG